jgi:hypothetical protein
MIGKQKEEKDERYLAEWYRERDLDLYSSSARFEARPEHWLSWLGLSHGFAQSFQTNARIILRLDPSHFLVFFNHYLSITPPLASLHIHGVHCAGLSDFSVHGAARQHFSRQVAQLFRRKLLTVKWMSNQPALWTPDRCWEYGKITHKERNSYPYNAEPLYFKKVDTCSAGQVIPCFFKTRRYTKNSPLDPILKLSLLW